MTQNNLEVKKCNIEEIVSYADKCHKKIIFFSAVKEDINKITCYFEYMNWYVDDWKTPDWCNENRIQLKKLHHYIDSVITADFPEGQVGEITVTDKVKIPLLSVLKLLDINEDEYIIWVISNENIEMLEQLQRIIQLIPRLNNIELFSNEERYRAKSRGFFIQRMVEPYFFCMKNHLFMSSEEQLCEWDRVKKIISNNGLVIPNIAFEITTKCTLRCKNCVEYNPYTERYDADVDTIIEQTDKLLQCIDHLLYFQVTTGECLLYPDLEKLLNYLFLQPKIEKILILTNGIKLPNPAIMNLLKNPKIMIQMSDYNFAIQEQNLNKYKEEGIDIRFFGGQKWFSWGGDKPIYDRHLDVDTLKKVYSGCRQGKSCPRVIINGKMYNCGRTRRFEQLGDYKSIKDNYCIDFNNSIEVIKKGLINNYLIDYLEACSFCDFQDKDVTIIPAGEQLRNPE